MRVRYPQDVSTSFDAALALTGTSDASTLSGTVTLNRTALNLTADFGQVLAEAAQANSVIEQDNEYLSGMQLDLRIQNGPNFQLETTLATDVEADVDLRVRGTPSRPGVTGQIAINRGQMQVFGNRYTVERGDIRFLNPLKIEPRFDMDLSTRARGVRPCFFACSSFAKRSAAEPSFTPEALPAVTVPSGFTTPLSFASASSVVSGRGCSSV